MDVKPLNRDQIIEKDDSNKVRVDIPEWEGFVFVKMMTGEERDAFEESLVDRNGQDVRRNLQNFRSKLSARVVCDENGNLLFDEKDILALGRKSARALDRIVTAAQRLNAIEQKDVEDLTKNS